MDESSISPLDLSGESVDKELIERWIQFEYCFGSRLGISVEVVGTELKLSSSLDLKSLYSKLTSEILQEIKEKPCHFIKILSEIIAKG